MTVNIADEHYVSLSNKKRFSELIYERGGFLFH